MRGAATRQAFAEAWELVDDEGQWLARTARKVSGGWMVGVRVFGLVDMEIIDGPEIDADGNAVFSSREAAQAAALSAVLKAGF